MFLLRNSKGQSAIEASIVVFIAATSVSVFMCSIYLIYASYWAEHILYEALICQQERGQSFFCTKEAKQKITSTLFLKDNYIFRLEKRGSKTRAVLQMEFHPPFIKRKTFSFQKELKI